MITRSVFLVKVGTSMKSPQYSIETMGYHSLLFTESCLIFSGLIFFSLSSNDFAAMIIRRNFVIRTGFFHFCTHLHMYPYDVAYRNNEFFRRRAFNFFRYVFYYSNVWDRFFPFFWLSEVNGDLLSRLVAVL